MYSKCTQLKYLAHICNPRIWEIKAAVSVQRQLATSTEFAASLGCVRPVSKREGG